MLIRLPYGEHGLDAEVPDAATVLVPERTPPLADAGTAVRAAIAGPIASPPLATIARRGQRAAIVVSDVTRPVPNAVILPPLLETLEAAGVARDDVTIVVGTGLHRPSRPDEHRRILGDAILGRYRVVDHVARGRSTQAYLMTTARGVEVWLSRAYLEADLRIVTGFVEPHLFAGYSGGGKGVMPGIAGAEAIMANHGARMIGHPRATWCVTDGNPIFEEMRDVALRSEPSFTVNVTLDERQRITGVFAGELAAAHDAAIAQAARQAVRPIPHLYDVVVVTNMGYPADLVLYQSVKGMSVAAQACAPGGAILLVAECREGVGGDEYVELLHGEASPQALLRGIESEGHETAFDQWQVQVQAMVQARCDVWLCSSLPRETVEAAHLSYAPDVTAALARIIDERRTAAGREPSVCVLPHGQMTVPRVAAG
ncbi:MAG TPA: nickel-dependent lactate racemase [Dehalococcoidia bacterium]|nr:nickel-dependent lactate racemase [Dehalococcoidia bacterium]